ncbi:MAG: hypothetical protein GDA56_17315 [Hormoscilla sp. GM7CHS1pb]|nr:hypothetical protein [Hormoscilla sp. GM7CHS1pb]
MGGCSGNERVLLETTWWVDDRGRYRPSTDGIAAIAPVRKAYIYYKLA